MSEGLYRRNFASPRRERAFLGAVGFTATFVTVRAITLSIRAGIGPFGNISAGGRRIHHSTIGILGLLACGYVWTYQWGLGTDPDRRWASRLSATACGVASALTIDEFALWLDLHDEYWHKGRGRKAVEAVALFGGLLTLGVASRGALTELGLLPRILRSKI